ncbi:hypothetical protein [Thiobacillus sp. 65-1402]|uniref:hypothetical protein n=1 Tax=Thiobacillus sp. 65-1402 TaxID=1895861 RepID=UPI000963B7FA|nr:hypothetical protein [Thiobacillus sp. 65-1402]OJW76986.1 MAG: hypothetical protein BGO62_06695 [Thiobacillus sp. 65-1402]
MKIEILNIASPIDAATAERAGAILKTMPGVHEVSYFDAPASLHARLDHDAPTRAELVAELARVGVQVEAERPAHASGSCCGGCGS